MAFLNCVSCRGQGIVDVLFVNFERRLYRVEAVPCFSCEPRQSESFSSRTFDEEVFPYTEFQKIEITGCIFVDNLSRLITKLENCLIKIDPDHQLVQYTSIWNNESRKIAFQGQLRKFSDNPQIESGLKDEMEIAYAMRKYLTALGCAINERALTEAIA